MNSALDHEAFNITAGYIVSSGSSGTALPPGDLSAQYSAMLNFQTANQVGTLISVRSSDGTELFTFEPVKRYQSIVFSMPVSHWGRPTESTLAAATLAQSKMAFTRAEHTRLEQSIPASR